MNAPSIDRPTFPHPTPRYAPPRASRNAPHRPLRPSPRPTRHGSVLLLTVVLLVLLAIMGTAYLATTRNDRASSGLHVANSQIDQLVDSSKGIALGAIANAAYDTTQPSNTFRPGETANYPNGVGNYRYVASVYGQPIAPTTGGVPPTALLTAKPTPQYTSLWGYAGDEWLADRVPTMNPAENTVMWDAITGPLNTLDAYGYGFFESPDGGASNTGAALYPDHYHLTPTTLALTSVGGETSYYPAFQLNGVTGGKVIAGDATGAGIADCGLSRLPGVSIDSLTYYLGLRIIDNNSAINVNTAGAQNGDTMLAPSGGGTAPAAMPLGIFPSSVGINALLSTTDYANLVAFRLNGNTPSANMVDDGNPTPRTDANFISDGDQLFHQLSRRLQNPGYYSYASASSNVPLIAFGDADNGALAYHFGLADPSMLVASTSGGSTSYSAQTLIEGTLASLFTNAPNLSGSWAEGEPAGYVTTSGQPDTANWYTTNFVNQPGGGTTGYVVGTAPTELRPLLVTRNGVSNAMPAYSADPTTLTCASGVMLPYGDRGRWQKTVVYQPGDIVSYSPVFNQPSTLITGDPNCTYQSSAYYVCVKTYDPAAAAQPPCTITPGTAGATSTFTITPNTTYWVRPALYSAATTYDVPGNAAGNPTYCYYPSANGGTVYELYRAVQTASGQTPASNPTYFVPATGGGNTVPPKAGANTATFPELFRAFWNVMSTNQPTVANPALYSPFRGVTTPVSPIDPNAGIYAGNHFITPPATPLIQAASDNTGVTTPNPTPQNLSEMFRSSIRDGRTLSATIGKTFDPYQMVLLRAAIAAVNTETLRQGLPYSTATVTNPIDTIARQVPLALNVDGTATAVNAVVYGNTPQPYITEIYAQNDISSDPTNGSNPSGYVAIELYNPYPFPITLTNWTLATVPRTTTAALTPTAISPNTNGCTFSPTTLGEWSSCVAAPTWTSTPPVVPANGYLVIENYDGNPSATAGAASGNSQPAKYRPTSSGLPATGVIPARTTGVGGQPALNDCYVPNLTQVYGNELVLLKPRIHNGTLSAGTDGPYTWDEVNNLYDRVPVDSFDFTTLTVGTATSATVWHYARPNDPTSVATTWRFIYPGRYCPPSQQPTLGQTNVGAQEGTIGATWTPGAGANGTDPWESAGSTVPVITLGSAAGGTTPLTNANSVADASYTPTFPVQLSNVNWGGPNPVAQGASTGNMYPFGGFARDGDLLQVPFIGSYVILQGTGAAASVYEMNSVTMDAAMAEDTDDSDDIDGNLDPLESVGRFCPVIVTDTPAGATVATNPQTPSQANDNSARWGTAGTTSVRYGWARSLFDCLTVDSPRDDYLPNVDPDRYAYLTGTTPSTVANERPPTIPPGTTPSSYTATPAQHTANTNSEDTTSVQGKININTAPWKVLATLPLVVDDGTGQVSDSSGSAPAYRNELMAKAIVADRMTYGPFQSIFDLNRVVNTYNTAAPPASPATFLNDDGFITAATALTTTQQLALGDLSYYQATATSNVSSTPPMHDFKYRYLNLTRLSNLITTRSDTFTVYGVVEGWQNAGTAQAALIVTRRFAMIVDANSLTPASRTMRTVTVPTN